MKSSVRRTLVVIAALLTATGGAVAADRMKVGEDSQKACRARADLNYSLCLLREDYAAGKLTLIATAIPEEMMHSCSREAIASGDAYKRGSLAWALDCLHRRLEDMPEAQLPRGSATLYIGSGAHRFWTGEECLQSRSEGQVCVIH